MANITNTENHHGISAPRKVKLLKYSTVSSMFRKERVFMNIFFHSNSSLATSCFPGLSENRALDYTYHSCCPIFSHSLRPTNVPERGIRISRSIFAVWAILVRRRNTRRIFACAEFERGTCSRQGIRSRATKLSCEKCCIYSRSLVHDRGHSVTEWWEPEPNSES